MDDSILLDGLDAANHLSQTISGKRTNRFSGGTKHDRSFTLNITFDNFLERMQLVSGSLFNLIEEKHFVIESKFEFWFEDFDHVIGRVGIKALFFQIVLSKPEDLRTNAASDVS